MRLIDLSHTIHPDMPRFSQHVPPPQIRPWMSHAESAQSGAYIGTTCEISQVNFITSLGTYLDSPYHFHISKPAIQALQLEQLILPGIKIDCTDALPDHPIEPDCLAGKDLRGKAVLFYTGWSNYWGSPQYYHPPYLSADTARSLVREGARMVGVDFLVVDNMRDPRRPVHVTLLGADILIVENLTNLASLPEGGFIFHAVPPKVAGAAAFPVRAYAVMEETFNEQP